MTDLIDALAEEIGDPDLFVGRKAELERLMKCAEGVKKRISKWGHDRRRGQACRLRDAPPVARSPRIDSGTGLTVDPVTSRRIRIHNSRFSNAGSKAEPDADSPCSAKRMHDEKIRIPRSS